MPLHRHIFFKFLKPIMMSASSQEQERPRKRQKTTSGVVASTNEGDVTVATNDLSVVFTEGLTSATNAAKLGEAYAKAEPYPHAVLPTLCREDHFEKVKAEIVQNLKTNFKETDLFKFFQTTDLANVDASQPELAAKLPALLKLREALYSREFRDFVSTVTGCPELTERVDMAASVCEFSLDPTALAWRPFLILLWLTPRPFLPTR